MPVMRVLLFVLLLCNVLVLAANLGWLGTSAPQGEPERITNQIAPERIVLRPAPRPPATPLAAPVVPQAARVAPAEDLAADGEGVEAEHCVAYAGLTGDEADALTRVADAYPAIAVERSSSATPSAWWVRIPPAGSRAAAERAATELRALGVTDLFVVQEPGPNLHAISLGLFKTEASARQHLAVLRDKRVKGASVTTRSAIAHRVELLGPRETVRALASQLPVALRSSSEGECAR